MTDNIPLREIPEAMEVRDVTVQWLVEAVVEATKFTRDSATPPEIEYAETFLKTAPRRDKHGETVYGDVRPARAAA